jgi:hypothetical protein
MKSARFALLSTAAIFALGLTTLPAGAAVTTGQVLNTPVDTGGPSPAAQEAAKSASAAPTTGQVLNTPVDTGLPPKEMQDAAKKSAAAAPTTGQVLNTPVDKGLPS